MTRRPRELFSHLALGGRLFALALFGFSVPAWAFPILHERLSVDPSEDAALSDAGQGELSSALRTPSGVAVAPNLTRPADPRTLYSSGELAPFQPDRDTRRPEVERYDDPFSPVVTPFKRTYAYDAVRDDYRLYVRDSELRPILLGGEVNAQDDGFFGDLTIRVSPGAKVRIPTVGPGSRLIKMTTRPRRSLRVWRDGADNWFVTADATGRIRLVTEIAIEREVFASTYDDVDWSRLQRVPLQPVRHRRAFSKVARAIGIARHSMRPKDVVAKMVAYFRSFAPSAELPAEHVDIYLDLALARKGVCRHRAFAFLVTALNIGIPTRLIHNEAHAWVEVHDGSRWRRIDLGGAAADLAQSSQGDRPSHQPPPDRFAWPKGRDSGAELARRERREAAESSSSTTSGDGNEPTPPPSVAPQNAGAPATVTVDAIDHDVFRGLALKLSGRVRAEGRGCERARVDVVIRVAEEERVVGALSTDERGVYDGSVVIPPSVPTGDHELYVRTLGAGHCGSGSSL